MAQICKIETKADIKCPPAKFYDFLKYNKVQFANMLPHIFKSVQILQGEEGQPENIILFEYILLGKTTSFKVMFEEINDIGERFLTSKVLEGEVMKDYKSFGSKISVGDGCSVWCIEFEKANDSVPNPNNHAKLTVEIMKGIDLYLLTN